ncbi:MAG: hydroxylamine reductase, partial [Eubacteriales bacterium]|nr:hydroxylamine reductase [Eubacteriales bacterium]
MDNKMFCFQCQEAAKGIGCTIKGVCGKDDTVAGLQDLLIHTLKEISLIVRKGQLATADLTEVSHQVVNSLFMTITNANFDADAIDAQIRKMVQLREDLKNTNPGIETGETASWQSGDRASMLETAKLVGVLATDHEDVRSLRELVIYGLKGMAAYTEHTFNLGKENPAIYEFMYEALSSVLDDSLTADQL